MLTETEIDRFVTDGFVRIERAFPEDLAHRCRDLLWPLLGCDPDDPGTWTRPVVRLGDLAAPPFREAANTRVLHTAFDQLVGAGRWLPRGSLGTFPVRFPSPDDPGDTGWHADASFGHVEHPTDFLRWRVNAASKGRALLMLFLFSEVGENDAPTRIRVGSHVDLARHLAPFGDAGLSLGELVADGFGVRNDRPVALATGGPGTVFLCHPFLVHAAQPHRGRVPRLLAQPPLLPREPWGLDRPEVADMPVARAVRQTSRGT